MKTVYKGFEIDVYRERSLGGWDNVYYGVHRMSDGWELTSGWFDGSNTVRDVVRDMKETVDEYEKNPRLWDDPEFHESCESKDCWMC